MRTLAEQVQRAARAEPSSGPVMTWRLADCGPILAGQPGRCGGVALVRLDLNAMRPLTTFVWVKPKSVLPLPNRSAVLPHPFPAALSAHLWAIGAHTLRSASTLEVEIRRQAVLVVALAATCRPSWGCHLSRWPSINYTSVPLPLVGGAFVVFGWPVGRLCKPFRTRSSEVLTKLLAESIPLELRNPHSKFESVRVRFSENSLNFN